MSDQYFDVTQAAKANKKQAGLYENVTGQAQALDQKKQQQRQEFDGMLPVSDYEYKAILPAITNASDPEAAKYTMAAAIQYSRLLGKPLEDTIQNLEAYHNEWVGETFIPKTGFKAVTDAYRIGVTNLDMARLARQWEREGGEDSAEVVGKIKEYKQTIEQLRDNMPRKWWVEAMKMGAESAPFTLEVIGSGLIAGTVAAGTAIAATAAGGVTIGSGGTLGTIAAPLTIGMFQAAGSSFGAFKQSMELQKGFEYLRLREEGLEHGIASTVSSFSSAAQAATEIALGNVPSLMNALQKTGTQRLTADVLKTMGVRGVLSRAGKSLIGYTEEAAMEGLEEAIQEIQGGIASAISEVFQKEGVNARTADQVALDAVESFKGGFLASLVMGIPGEVINYKGSAAEAERIKKMAANLEQADFIRLAKEEGSEMLSGLSEEEKDTALRTIWEVQQKAKTKKAEKAQEEELKELKKKTTAPINRLEDGSLYTSTKVVTDTEDGTRAILKAGDPATGKRYGVIDYTVQDEEITINRFDVQEGISQDVKKEMLVDLMKANPDLPIKWETEDEAEIQLKELLKDTAPTIQDGENIQWFKDMTPEEYKAAQELDEQIKTWMPKLDENQRKGAGALLKARAVALDMTLDKYLETYHIEGIFRKDKSGQVSAQDARGGVSFKEIEQQAKAIIYTTENSDFSTWVHENAHVFRQQLEGEQLTAAEKAFKVIGGEWTTENEEAFATGFERYLQEGKAPTKELKTLYDKFKNWLDTIYRELKNRIRVNPDISAIYDSLFMQAEKPLKTGLKPGAVADEMLMQPTITAEAKTQFETAATELGITEDIDEAGYVLPDGRMIDLSGKGKETKQWDKYRFQEPGRKRTLKHFAVTALGLDYEGFMKAGAVRIDAIVGAVEMHSQPTEAQLAVVGRMINEAERPVQIALEANGKEVFFDSEAESSKQLGQIRQFYRTGEINERILFQKELSQMDEVRALYENTDTWMKAPNGQPTKLNERQWLQVRTPAFKAWFGDWENDPENASKVVDDNGEPLVVYHGTDKNFTIFDQSQASKSSAHPGGYLGFYFADYTIASGFAGDEGELIPAYLDIKNPETVSASTFQEYLGGEKAMESALKEAIEELSDSIDETIYFSGGSIVDLYGQEIDNTDFTDEQNQMLDKIYEIGNNDPRDLKYSKTEEFFSKWKKTAESNGFDGVIVDSDDFTSPFDKWKELKKDNYIVFSPTQIKSATANTGAFDAGNPSILFQSAVETASKNLLAVHNIKSRHFMDAVELGGIAMPSMAIINKNIPFDNFGDITLLIPKDIVDPKKGRSKVFNADVYSPRYPSPVYEVDNNALNEIINKIGPAINEIAHKSKRETSVYVLKAAIADLMERDGIEYLNDRWLQAYWKNEIKKESSTYEETVNQWNDKDEVLYREWIKKTFEPIITGKKMWAGTTNMGRNRYIPYTLENILKAMKKQGIQGGEGFGYGLPTLRAAVAKQYKSLTEIKKDENKILSDEEFEKAKEATDRLFDDIMIEAAKTYKYEWSFNTGDSFVENVIDGIKRGNIKAELEKYGFNLTEETLEKLRLLITTIREMPTEYFEAKVKGNLYFNEIAGAVIPSSTEENIRQVLKSYNKPIAEYKEGDKTDRARAITELAESIDEGNILFQPQVYHGSTHSFDRFSTDHIGTGEGAQAFGWGMYFTEEEDIAKQYASGYVQARNNAEIIETYVPKGEQVSVYKNIGRFYKSNISFEDFKIQLNKIYNNAEWLNKLYENMPSRNFYTVTPSQKSDFDEMTWLDWDKPLPEDVKNKIAEKGLEEKEPYKIAYKNEEGKTVLNTGDGSGEWVYKELIKIYGSDKEASLFLNRAGIDGIRYPANFLSGGNKDGKSNFVVFDENAVKIQEKILFQKKNGSPFYDAADDIIQLAKDAKNWQEFKKAFEAFEDPADNDAWYQDFYEQVQKVEKSPKEPTANEEADQAFVKRMQSDEEIIRYLETLWYEGIDESPQRMAQETGIETEEDYELLRERTVKAERVIREATPLIHAASISVGKGRTLAPQTIKSIRTMFTKAPRDFRILEALTKGDYESLKEVESAIAERQEIKDPRWIRALEGGTIYDRVRLANQIKNEQIAKRIRTGEIYLDDESREYLDNLSDKIKDGQKELNRLQAEIATQQEMLGRKNSRIMQLSEELAKTQRQYDQVTRRITRFVKEQKAIAGQDIQRQNYLLKDIERIQANINKALDSAKGDKAKAVALLTKLEVLEKEKAKQRELKAEERALKEIRNTMIRLGEAITKEPSKGVDIDYADAIRDLQQSVDPKFRSRKYQARTEKMREFFEKNPEAKEQLSDKVLRRINRKPLNEWTLDELRDLYDRIQELRQIGRLKRKLMENQETRLRDRTKKKMSEDVLQGEPLKKAVGTAKPTTPWNKVKIESLKPDRIVKMLGGAWEEWLIDKVNEAWNITMRAIDKRTDRIKAKLEENLLTLDPLDIRIKTKGFIYVGKQLDINGFEYDNGKKPTIQDVMYWYIGMNNERTAKALLAGNMLPEAVISKGISMLTQEQLNVANAIAKDFETNYPRLRETVRKLYNVDLAPESFYVPHRRLDISYETRSDEIAHDLAHRNGMTKAFVEKGFIKSRVDINDERQTPIRTDLIGLWFEGVQKEEAFINQDQLIKRLHAIAESMEVRRAVQQKYGSDMNKWISKYINDLAKGDVYQAMTGAERLQRTLRSNVAVAYLSFNVLSNLKQLVSVFPFIADAGVFNVMKAAGEYLNSKAQAVGKGQFINSDWLADIEERSPLIKHRSISREFEELKRTNGNLYNEIIKKIGKTGMISLEVIDKVSVAIGWKAVYNKAIDEGKSEAEAAVLADKSVVRGQPSGRVQDLADIYRAGDAFKWFTMFTNALNAFWNMAIFDIPQAIKERNIGKAAGDFMAISLSGVGIAIAAGALAGDDDEEKKKKLISGVFSQFTDSIPLVGAAATSIMNTGMGLKTYRGGGVEIFPAAESLRRAMAATTNEDYEAALKYATEGVAYAAGLPVAGPKRAIKAIKEKYPLEIIGISE